MKVLEPTEELQQEMPAIRKGLCQIRGDTLDSQERIQEYLMSVPSWRDWIDSSREKIGLEPVLVRPGLQTARDDAASRKTLIGLARCMEPKNYVPKYEIGDATVTQVLSKSGSTAASHSMNDLPAPPHTAGFFEPIPPHTCYFSCIRPHPGGGAETTVINLERVLEKASPDLITTWRNKVYTLHTSRRLGRLHKEFRVLQDIAGLPFLRYREEYIVGFEIDPSLIALGKLLSDPSNHYVVPLQADETVFHWNGLPHSRFPQNGPTPENVNLRRKLIRCRTQPYVEWG